MPNRSNPSFWQILRSVGASLLGVQSQQNYQHDFQQNSVLPYIIVGTVVVTVLVIALATLVNLLV